VQKSTTFIPKCLLLTSIPTITMKMHMSKLVRIHTHKDTPKRPKQGYMLATLHIHISGLLAPTFQGEVVHTLIIFVAWQALQRAVLRLLKPQRVPEVL
jgi:hypothetical protein